jgi:2-polyprenyl-3-methyl-5-hydroxy-6-metoxy-1,4-benzoquinol methylase
MAQITSGVRSVLSRPSIYDFVQNLVGVVKQRRILIADHFELERGMRVLDVGCGTGELFAMLPAGLDYVGIDLSAQYIAQAQARYGAQARFVCANLNTLKGDEYGAFDRVIGTGILHHLDDGDVDSLMAAARRCLKPSGRWLTVDPTFVADQSRLARAVIKRDRGQNVRAPDAYGSLAKAHFGDVRAIIRHDLLRIPYTHCILDCRV